MTPDMRIPLALSFGDRHLMRTVFGEEIEAAPLGAMANAIAGAMVYIA
jgi:hypothetical protein